MRAVIVDDEELMIHRFQRLGRGIEDLEVTAAFTDPEEALAFLKENPTELLCVDIRMPLIDGTELSKEARRLYPGILIVFISAHDGYLREFNEIGGDYYILKPFSEETLLMMMEKLRLLKARQRKDIFIRTFGRFTVMKNGTPIPLSGKPKEILAYIVAHKGAEVSNETIFSEVWENDSPDHDNMKTYYNALKRLKDQLKASGAEGILISTARGQMAGRANFDCDYYEWEEGGPQKRESFTGQFMSEYSWGENMLSEFLPGRAFWE